MDRDDPDMQSLVNKRGRKKKEQERFIKLSDKEHLQRLENQRNDLEAYSILKTCFILNID